MPDRPVCLYDANVLSPAQMRDFLMRLGLGEVVRVHWTERVHEEWMRNVEAGYPDITYVNQGLKNHVAAGGLKEDAPTSL